MPIVYFLWAAWKKSELQLLIDTCLRDTWRCLMFSQNQHNTSLKSSFARGQLYPLPKRRSNSSWEGRQGPLGTLIRWWKPWSDSFFEQNQEFRLCRSAEEILKYLLMLSGNNGRLGERSGAFFVFVPYPGHFVAEQNRACCVMQQLAKVQMPKAGPSFQSITELLPFVPEWQTCRNMGEKVSAEGKQEWVWALTCRW